MVNFLEFPFFQINFDMSLLNYVMIVARYWEKCKCHVADWNGKKAERQTKQSV